MYDQTTYSYTFIYRIWGRGWLDYKISEKSDDFCNIGSDCLLLKQHIGDNFFVMDLGFLDINRFVIFSVLYVHFPLHVHRINMTFT